MRDESGGHNIGKTGIIIKKIIAGAWFMAAFPIKSIGINIVWLLKCNSSQNFFSFLGCESLTTVSGF